MALRKDVVIQKQNFDGSLVARNAYWKITNIGGNKNGFSISVDAFVNDVFCERITASFIPTLDGQNFIAQAYQHLKTLPEFAGAIDC
jgi:hypothetical protein